MELTTSDYRTITDFCTRNPFERRGNVREINVNPHGCRTVEHKMRLRQTLFYGHVGH